MRDHILFCSQGRIGIIEPYSGRENYLELDIPHQVRWQPGPTFSDGKRGIMWSQEPALNPRADFHAKDGTAFARTHVWVYDFTCGDLHEIRLPSLMYVVALLPGEERVLVSGNMGGRMYLLTAELSGEDQRTIHTQEGYGYGTSLSPDGTHAAYHITSVPCRNPYEIYVIGLETGKRMLLASDPDYLNFGTDWSPDGRWVLYQRCAYKHDPGHDRSDLCISRSDGSEKMILTRGQSHWFATSYGSPATRGGGSNLPRWAPDGGAITHTRRLLLGSRTAWQYRPDRPDRDHFNRDYKPEEARGGTEICVVDPRNGDVTAITDRQPLMWNWRAEWSPDSRSISFSRAAVGCPSEVWMMDADGSQQRLLTRGLDDMGADFARFSRLAPFM